MTDDPLENYELVFLLGMAYQQVLGAFVLQLDAAGYDDLRPVHGFALQVIVRSGGVTSSALGQQLGMTKQAAGQIVDHLVERGYLTRDEHPLGGRRRLLVLTPKGKLHMRRAGRLLQQVERDVTREVGAKRLTRLRQDLVAIVRTGLPAPEIPHLRPHP